MTPQELKNSILQLAIQGKLVDQRPEEGTAEDLYRQIQAEKQALIKAGKLKKEKPLLEITEDEKPFDIPESWMWVRVRDCISNRAGLAYDKSNLDVRSGKMIRVLRGGNISDMGYSQKEDDVLISSEFVKTELLLRRNTIITPAVTSLDHVGKMGRIEKDYDDMVVGGFVLMLTPYYDNDIFAFYLMYAFSSKYFRDLCRGIVNKSGQAFYNLSREKMMALVIPLPPLAEQKRIVAKIEELLPLIERYEKAWSRLEDFNKRFPGDMQKSILQMAIQGKLVEQRPEEGTGEDLYRQIQAEKQSLIRSGKLKKDKPLPEITEDEKPFDIPGNWKWIHLGDICSVTTGRLDANAQNPNGKYAFFTCGVEVYKTTDYAFDCDAILLGGNNASGDYKMHRYAGKFNAYQRVYVITDPPKETLDYLNYVIKWWLPSLKRDSQGTTTRFIKLGQVNGMLVPFPPLAEQKRIVAKLESLLPLCDKLK